MQKPLPIGIDNFEKMITRGYYLIDKTSMVKELLEKKGDVNLFTRPRRFGKTLNMSMLQYFFEDARNDAGERLDHSGLFRNLQIMQAGEKYLSHMGRYPVINLTFKSAKQPDYPLAHTMLKRQIAGEFKRHLFVLKGETLLPDDRDKYIRIMEERGIDSDYVDALQFLSRCLNEYYGKKVIILIDEYDVPLENAHLRGFYQEMVDFIRSLFESALKTNPNLEFAVVTGCLRISKESIFTGLNNLNIISILSNQYAEYFGFTDEEVRKLCEDYGVLHRLDDLKQWYNGYLFGKTNVYNPWSVMKFMYDVSDDGDAFPSAYWANTSSNSIVRELIDRADRDVKKEIELLIEGGTLAKPIHEDITYDEVYKSMDNLWNFLFFTGYFRIVRKWMDPEAKQLWAEFRIPNWEVQYIFRNKVSGWFEEYVKGYDRSRLLNALVNLDVEAFQEELAKALWNTISYYDNQESFYHGFLAGMLAGMEDYQVKSNRESGNGRSDLWIKPMYHFRTAFVLEFKIAEKNRQLEEKADEALAQIGEKGYAEEVEEDGYEKVYRYGIAFCGKRCLVKLQ